MEMKKINGIECADETANLDKKEDYRTKELISRYNDFFKDNMKPLKTVKYYLSSAYKWGKGWSLPEEEAFNKVVISRFGKDWDIVIPSSRSDALEGFKKYTSETIYFHPMEVACEIQESSIEEVLKLLMDFPKEIGEVKRIRIENNIYAFRPHQLVGFMLKNKKFFQEELLKECETPTTMCWCDLFKNFFITGSGSVETQFIKEEFLRGFFDELVDEGKLKEVKEKTPWGVTTAYQIA